MRPLIAMLTVAALGGCAANADVKPLSLNVVGSDYCQIASRIQWSMDDTKKTVDQARGENAKWRKLCLPPKPIPKTS